MKKTILSVLAALLTLTLLLAGCSTPGDSQQKETTSAVTQESQGSESVSYT
ncbi:MAG TPA: sulfonate/nitrate/taurine transporter substrate-binding protein, partial [Ruminiclostridium sp.]|nr:sulfonate/nitrate/taurine transporter substrate-binding protein [Ruminiclostridium sp.]